MVCCATFGMMTARSMSVSISKHIEKMLDGLCWACEGSGETYGLDDRKDLLLCDRSFIWTTCPKCGGDGLKTKDQIRREEEAVNALNQRLAEKGMAATELRR